MTRADRLSSIVALLRRDGAVRAEDIARHMKVSLRTIYRDMDSLRAAGLPITGTRGTGYKVTAEVTLPPLNLTKAELEALHLGLAVVGEAAEADLRDAALSLSEKIDAVLDISMEDRHAAWGYATGPLVTNNATLRHLAPIRAAIVASQKLHISPAGSETDQTERIVRPLELNYWGRIWTLTAWSETDNCFQTFRVDQIAELHVLPALFVEEPGKRIADYHRSDPSSV